MVLTKRIRINGRGGQGGKTMAEHMAMIFYDASGDHPYVSSEPTFGPERRGALLDAYVWLSNEKIREHGAFSGPDMVIVLDATIPQERFVRGLKQNGILLINTRRAPQEFPDLAREYRLSTVDAGAIAMKHGLGNKATPIVGTAILGAFLRVSGLAPLEKLYALIDEELKKKKPEANKLAAADAFNCVRTCKKE